MWVGEIDVDDDQQLEGFWAAGQEGDAFGRPYATERSLEATTVGLRESSAFSEILPMVARDGDEVLGVSEVVMPKLDNTHLAFVETSVRPAHRRKGIGTALHDAAEAAVRSRGRITVISEVHMPFESPPSSAGSAFLAARGYSIASLEIHRVLGLPSEETHLERLASAAAPRHVDYTLRSFRDRVPEELVAGFCALQAAFNAQAPLGDLDLEPEVWDEKRVRMGEERSERMGRHVQATVALDGAGTVVALTEMVTTHHLPDLGWQSGTLVLPEHRGHRLGVSIKVANQRAFQAAFPRVSIIHSWNAEENGPMVAINDALGFRPVEYLAEMQRRLPAP